MFDKDGRYGFELNEEGLSARLDYCQGGLTLSIHSLTDYVSGGDWGAGYRYSWDWEIEIPVYDEDDWQTAEKKALRRYREYARAQRRQREIERELSEQKKSNIFYKLLVCSTPKKGEQIARLQAAGFHAEARLHAEALFLEQAGIHHWEEWAQVQPWVASLGFEMPETWQEDRFDDLVVCFIHRGCQPNSEELICQLLELDKAKARQVLPEIVIAKSEGRLDSERFIDFLQEKEIFSAENRRQWARRVLRSLIGEWLGKTLKGADENSLDYYQERAKKEALTLWRKMGEWCEKEGIAREEVQAVAIEYIEEWPRSPIVLELLGRAFDLYQPLLDKKAVEYLAQNIKQDIYETYPEYVEQALAMATENPRRELLEDWVPLSFEEKQEIARALIQKMFKGELYLDVEEALKWNEDFKLHISELDALAQVIERAESPETPEPKRELARRGILENFEVSDKFRRMLDILADRGPSAEIRLRAEELKRWLEYEIRKSFPNHSIKIDIWGILALSQLRGDVPVGAGVIDVVEAWLNAEPKAAENQKVLDLATGLERAVENVLSGSSRKVARKKLEGGE